MFTGENGDGLGAQAGPIVNSVGNVYGTTRGGGGSLDCDEGCGTVYELQPQFSNVDGYWKEQILHAFGSFPDDGRIPSLGNLAMDRVGNLYGATNQGGSNICVDIGCGTVFKLSPAPDGKWTETILYNFTPAIYGPGGGVTFDGAGNLYGTTIYGGAYGCGAIYKLTPVSPVTDRPWRYTTLHVFSGNDGCLPEANMTLGPDGNLYGTTAVGGAGGAGVVFEITPD